MTMLALSIWFLMQSLSPTCIVAWTITPSAVLLNLCVGTTLFHASMFALRGPQEQFKRLIASDRLPYSMLTGGTLLAAYQAALERTPPPSDRLPLAPSQLCPSWSWAPIHMGPIQPKTRDTRTPFWESPGSRASPSRPTDRRPSQPHPPASAKAL